MERNKKEIIKVVVLATIFVLVLFGLYIFDMQTGKITELAKYLAGFVIE